MKRGVWIGTAGVALAVIAFFILMGLIYKQARIDEVKSADAIVVMGASQWNGEPSPVFAARLDHAYDLYRAGYAAKIILTGGVGDGEKFSESSAGKKHLLGKGVAVDALFLEEEGRTSWQNLKNIVNIIKAQNISSIILVSDGFHMFRLKKMSHDLGIVSYASPAKKSPITGVAELKYVAREVWVFVVYLVFKI